MWRWAGCSTGVPALSWRTGWLRSRTPTISWCSRTGGCASTDHEGGSRPTRHHTLPDCCAPPRRRLRYETTTDLALHAEDGPLRALAVPAARGRLEPDESALARAGPDRPRLFRHAHQPGAHASCH